MTQPENKRIETIQAILIAFLAALILRQFVVAAYKIPTSSMEDTLLIGDFLLVNKFVYGAKMPEWAGVPFTRWKKWPVATGFDTPYWLRFRLPSIRTPEKNDIVVFRFPGYPDDDDDTPQKEYIKRCIATGTDTVVIRQDQVYVNEIPFANPPTLKYVYPESREDFGPLLVEKEHFFMMGDNRDRSSDSREWGLVPPDLIIGKPLIIYLSLENAADEAGFVSRIRWDRLGMVVR